jgi:hypothetical protein
MKHLLFLYFVLMINKPCFSQTKGFRYGVHFGAGLAKIKNPLIQDQSGRPLFAAGFISAYQINKNVGIVAELLLTSKGSTGTGSLKHCCASYPYEEKYKLYYAEVPVMLKGSIGLSDLHIKFFSGPSVNFNLKGTQTKIFEDTAFNNYNGFKERKIPNLNFMEFSWVIGAGFEVELEENDILFLEIRNNIGLSPLGMINGRKAYNNYLAIGLGYLY